ncbi:hypothetical protein PACILC2_44540 [Paenibacillus cisolokensis]|uniref:Uncharacterized protein n=1 Tax=Paenibacillus cisolokensis TaxID=1658519 RepID=A0ABQ4NCE6_9BACL|nr:hypothetical protein [Paenibacillus cisolokensis]GIQ65886.1 hypothetical protein PACILC2_44540 [Paenibacillus cisolokensis]
MKIIVLCEKCGNAAEIKSETVGKLAYVQNQFKNRFRIDKNDVQIETSTSLNLNEQFIDELSSTEDEEEVLEVLEGHMLDNIDFESELSSLRVDCQNCGDYIVFTEIH